MSKIVLPAKMENLEKSLEFIDDQARSLGFLHRRIGEIRLAAEEVLVNIFCYAYPKADGDVAIYCHGENDVFILEILDRGIPFNILAAPRPDVQACLDDRCVGGLGIHFVKQMTTETRYVREKGQNRLILIFGKYRQK